MRAKLLYELPSKEVLVKEALNVLIGKTLIFANSLNSLTNITPNVISSKNTSEKNNQILNDFQNNKISLIGSFKMLEQGANLSHLNNIILHSYYGKEKSFIQRLGRGRKDLDTPINLIILLTKNTQEESWFNNMIGDTSLPQIWCNDINNFKTQYLNLNL